MGAPGLPVHKIIIIIKTIDKHPSRNKLDAGKLKKLPQLVRLVIFTDFADTVATRRAATIKNFILLVDRNNKMGVDLLCASTKHGVSHQRRLFYITYTDVKILLNNLHLVCFIFDK